VCRRSRETDRGHRHACGRKRARDQRRCAVADHPADGERIERTRAAGHEHGIDGFGKVASRIDERAVQVKYDQTKVLFTQI
jgi:hypothetical protein